MQVFDAAGARFPAGHDTDRLEGADQIGRRLSDELVGQGDNDLGDRRVRKKQGDAPLERRPPVHGQQLLGHVASKAPAAATRGDDR